jgi:pimeloyl-ACP methyl ester carboxylesterase
MYFDETRDIRLQRSRQATLPGGETEQMTTAAAAATRPKKRRWTKWLLRIIVAIAVVVVILIYGVGPFLLSKAITSAGTRPKDRLLTETPMDLGAEYKDIEFYTSDGVKISGWLLESRGRGATIIYSHGLFRSRRELLERAVELWRLGYGALLYDSRNHGQSGRAVTSLGYHERLDVEGAIRFLRDGARSSDKIVLLGVSMGAAADLLAAAETPDVSAVISDSSFLTFEDTVSHHVKLFLHLPSFPLANEFDYFISHRAGFEADKLSPIQAVKTLGSRPVLFIAGAHDPRMPPSIADQLYRASSSPESQILVIDGPDSNLHGHSYYVDRSLYIGRISQFLEAILGT